MRLLLRYAAAAILLVAPLVGFWFGTKLILKDPTWVPRAGYLHVLECTPDGKTWSCTVRSPNSPFPGAALTTDLSLVALLLALALTLVIYGASLIRPRKAGRQLKDATRAASPSTGSSTTGP
ncbi:hypothetical protein JOD54_000773 [Actinokineospora baliensis]|uniref:hypothetical protein n=1 Tax=Actinokineospora baliensis TaxID=547056 RepID=UPI00195D5B68|nr:hypothetical protein [Actinokineospora baliensis]MBM7770569.1 hypothetical protein [Actinokineospora baliensis]